MKQKLLVAGLFLVIIITHLGCDKYVDINGMDVLVMDVVCLANPDTTLSVRVKLPKCYGNVNTGSQCKPLVEVVNGEGKKIEMRSGAVNWGVFVSDYIPKEGETIKIVAKDLNGNYQTASSCTTVPYRADFSAYIKETNRKTIYRCVLRDKPGRDYYRLVVTLKSSAFSETSNMTSGLSLTQSTVKFKSDSDIFVERGEFSPIFTDDSFDGQNISFDVEINKTTPLSGNIETEIMLDMQTISAETYNYLLSWNPDFASTMDIYAEPTSIYTNVDGGFGLVGAVTENRVKNIFNPNVLKLKWVGRDLEKMIQSDPYSGYWSYNRCDFVFESGNDDWEIQSLYVRFGFPPQDISCDLGLRYDGERLYDDQYCRVEVIEPRRATVTIKQNDSPMQRFFSFSFKSGNFVQGESFSQISKP